MSHMWVAITTHIWIKSCHAYERVMSHLVSFSHPQSSPSEQITPGMSIESFHSYKWVQWVCELTQFIHTIESIHSFVWVNWVNSHDLNITFEIMSGMGIESVHSYEWVASQELTLCLFYLCRKNIEWVMTFFLGKQSMNHVPGAHVLFVFYR